jgi:tripartite-type tricarboxylate transporter receptor subunit TctC
MKRSLLSLVLLFGMVAGFVTTAAGEYPERPITLIAPFPAGGGVDRFSRGLTANADKYLGQTIVVKNISGAGGATGAHSVMKSKPDGYTLLAMDTSLTTLSLFQDIDLSYESFEPIAMVMRCPTWFLTPASTPYQNIDDLIAEAKKRPGEVNVGVAGPSGSQFLMALAFEAALGVDFNIVPLGGGGPLMKALVGKHVDAGAIHSPMGLDYVIKGDMRLLVAGGSMDTVVYDKTVPTFEQLNVPMEFSVYRGIFAPKGTPKDVVDKLAKAFEGMAKDEKFVQFGKSWGVMPKYADSESFKKILDNDMETFKKVKSELIDKK